MPKPSLFILPQFGVKRFFYSRFIWQFCLWKVISYYVHAVNILLLIFHRLLSHLASQSNTKESKFRLEMVRVIFRDRVNSNLNLTHCGVSKGSALRLRLTGSVVQPMSCYDLLTYKAIGSNYLSFVVTSMLVFHIATG